MPSPHPGSVSPKAHTTRQPPPTNTLTSTHAPTPGGAERLEFFKRVVSVPNAQKTTLAWSFSAFHRSELWVALITFLYLDFLDATGGARAPSGQGPSAGQHRFEHPRVLAPPPQHRSTPGTHPESPGTLFSMATMLGQRIPGFVEPKTKSFPRQARPPTRRVDADRAAGLDGAPPAAARVLHRHRGCLLHC